MKQSVIKNTPLYSMKNKKFIENSKDCGCYSCLALFPATEINEWTDSGLTALCPKCKVDSVLPEVEGLEITLDNMKIFHKYWFE